MKIACKNFVGAAVMVALLGALHGERVRGRDEPSWRDELGFKNGSQFIVS